MRRRTRLLVLAAAAGLIIPTMVDSAAGAIDQDLIVSATNGPPGTEVTASSASCVSGPDGDAYFEVSFYVGTAPNQQIAAYAQAFEGSATFTIPDWVDPDQPGEIQASCSLWNESTQDEENLAYDPVAFDIEPGAGTPVQVATFSRTELLAGQGLTITGSCGAGLPEASVTAIIAEGTDQTGQEINGLAGEGYTEAETDGSFELDVLLSDAYVSIDIEDDGSQITALGVTEEPLTIGPGDYTAFVYCSVDTEDTSSLQFLQPQAITVTGVAPTGGIDLTNEAGTADVTLAGTCEAGDVVGALESYSVEDFQGFDAPAPEAGVRTSRFAVARGTDSAKSELAGLAARANSVRVEGQPLTDRALGDEGYVEFEGPPGAGGTWSYTDAVGFDEGVVIGLAVCGDPLADGYFYDPQGVAVEVVEVPTTVPTTVTVPPTSPPADAVSGTPTYAG